MLAQLDISARECFLDFIFFKVKERCDPQITICLGPKDEGDQTCPLGKFTTKRYKNQNIINDITEKFVAQTGNFEVCYSMSTVWF